VLKKGVLDDTATWTEAVSTANAKRISVTDIGDTFYVRQLKIEVEDDTGSCEDFRLDKVTVHYATGF
jgi:hypothetical protein